MSRYYRFSIVTMEATQSSLKVPSRCHIIVLSAPFIFVSNAYAYIDPGTGSYVFQLIIAGLLAASFGIKVVWGRVKNFLRSILRFTARSPHKDE